MTDVTRIRTEESLDMLIASRFTGAYMNNHKWVKLINVLVLNASIIKKCIVKLVWDEKNLRTLLIDEHTSYQFEYYDTAMESMISGYPTGWYSYKEIEWIAFPKRSDTEGEQQDIESLYEILGGIGKLCSEISDVELIIYAYK